MTRKERYDQFREDMEAAGYEVEDYRGRYFYDGPAVICEPHQLQDVIRATPVRLQTDNMGLDLVVYPQ